MTEYIVSFKLFNSLLNKETIETIVIDTLNDVAKEFPGFGKPRQLIAVTPVD